MAASMEGEGDFGEDYYAMLNIDRQCTNAEIDAAYRRLTKIYHPDRHFEPIRKKKAENLFIKLKTAHNVLSDPNKRQIYDRFGVKGLQVEGLELMTRTRSPAEIIAELNRYQQEQEERKLQKRTNPHGMVTLGINATDVFDADPDMDDELNSYRSSIPSIEISHMSLHQSVEVPLTKKNTAIIAGTLANRNGNGNGAFTAVWRRLTSDNGWAELALSCGDNIGTSLRGFKKINRRCYCTANANISYLSNRGRKAIAFTGFQTMIACQLDSHLEGRLVWNVGRPSAMRTIIKYDKESYMLLFTAQLGIPNIFLQTVFVKKFPEKDAKVRLSAKVGTMGAVVEYGCETKVSQFSTLGATMAVGTSVGVSLKIKFIRGQQEFFFPIHLSESIVPEAIVYGTFLPLAIYFVAKKLIIDPYLKCQEEESQGKEKEEAAEKMAAKKEEAAATVELLKESVERSIESEERKRGLVILKALYGKLISDDEGELLDGQCIDVITPVQALVRDSQLILSDTKTKCDIPGFYDPCPGETKTLYIRYKFRNKLHQVTLADNDAIRLPLQKHLLKEDET
ncbi:dnaJ homolog subfamily C member 11-like [Mizuhopecten yessoensis]|uniref:dnaJ homolog subfamily C member 11-like n=1 Tax=Mizuhopecten yessoensis TaxID=6573 RepID=UPI000B45F0CD|nr:dnaJ homolog subfamily C member 11-like [Mizuhopecten yessoensis]